MRIPAPTPSGYPDHTQPVSFWRWIEYHFALWLAAQGYRVLRIGRWLVSSGERIRWHAIDPDDDIPF